VWFPNTACPNFSGQQKQCASAGTGSTETALIKYIYTQKIQLYYMVLIYNIDIIPPTFFPTLFGSS
jgi:hypothetical protein